MGHWVWVEHDDSGEETGRRNDNVDPDALLEVHIPWIDGQPKPEGEYAYFPPNVALWIDPRSTTMRARDLTWVD